MLQERVGGDPVEGPPQEERCRVGSDLGPSLGGCGREPRADLHVPGMSGATALLRGLSLSCCSGEDTEAQRRASLHRPAAKPFEAVATQPGCDSRSIPQCGFFLMSSGLLVVQWGGWGVVGGWLGGGSYKGPGVGGDKSNRPAPASTQHCSRWGQWEPTCPALWGEGCPQMWGGRHPPDAVAAGLWGWTTCTSVLAGLQ